MWPFSGIRKPDSDDNAKANALLLNFVTASPGESEKASKRILDRLHEEFTLPQISRTVANRVDADERDDTVLDMYTVVQVEVNKRIDLMRGVWLAEFAATGNDAAQATRRGRLNPLWIQDFLAVVGTETGRAWSKRLAKQNPVWAKLKADLAALLRSEPALALWPCPSAKKNTGGFAEWKGQPARMTVLLGLIKDDPLTYYRAAIRPEVPDASQMPLLVSALFERIKNAILVNHLTTIVQEIQEAREVEVGSLTIRSADGTEVSIEIGDSALTPHQQEMLRAYYRLSWHLLGALGSRPKPGATAKRQTENDTPPLGISLQRRVIALQVLSSEAPMGERRLDSVEIAKIAAALGVEIDIKPDEVRGAQELARDLQKDWESFAVLLTRLPTTDETDAALRRKMESRWSKDHLDDIGVDDLGQLEKLLGFPERAFTEIMLRLPFDDDEIAAACGSSVSSVREARSTGRLRLRTMLREKHGIHVDFEARSALDQKSATKTPTASPLRINEKGQTQCLP